MAGLAGYVPPKLKNFALPLLAVACQRVPLPCLALVCPHSLAGISRDHGRFEEFSQVSAYHGARLDFLRARARAAQQHPADRGSQKVATPSTFEPRFDYSLLPTTKNPHAHAHRPYPASQFNPKLNGGLRALRRTHPRNEFQTRQFPAQSTQVHSG